MAVVRVLAVVLVAAIGFAVLMYFLSGDRRWWRLARRMVSVSVALAVGFLALLFLERLASLL